eukprot:2593640-Amphidinium_carterae.3
MLEVLLCVFWLRIVALVLRTLLSCNSTIVCLTIEALVPCLQHVHVPYVSVCSDVHVVKSLRHDEGPLLEEGCQHCAHWGAPRVGSNCGHVCRALPASHPS